jgi:hypothetical protein
MDTVKLVRNTQTGEVLTLKLVDGQWVPAPAAQGPSQWDAIKGGASQGITYEHGDELRAALGASLDAGAEHPEWMRALPPHIQLLIAGAQADPAQYRNLRDADRAQLAAQQQAHPGAFMTGSLVGGVAAPAGAGGGWVAGAPSKGAALARMAGLGTIFGGIGGYGAEEEMTPGIPTATGAGLGAALSPTLGLAIPAISRLLGNVGRALKDSPEAVAEKTIAKYARESGLSVQDAIARLQELGPEGAPVDLNDALTALALKARGTSPGAAQRVQDFTKDRMGTARDRSRAIATGATSDLQGANVTGRIERARQLYRPDYEALQQQAYPITPALQDTMQTPHMKPIIDEATRMWQTRHRMPGVDPITTGGVIPGDLADNAKKLLDPRVKYNPLASSDEKAQRDLYSRLLTDWKGEADAAMPDYAAVRGRWNRHVGGPERAMTKGRDLFSTRDADLRELGDEFGGMNLLERQALRLGAGEDALQAAGNVRSAKDTGFMAGPFAGGSDDTLLRLQMLAGVDPKAVPGTPRYASAAQAKARQRLEQIQSKLEAEGRMHDVYTMLHSTTGSRTAIAADAANMGTADVSPLIEGIASRSPMATVSRILGSDSLSPEVADAVVDRLLNRGVTPADLQRMIEGGQLPADFLEILRSRGLIGAAIGASAATAGPDYVGRERN